MRYDKIKPESHGIQRNNVAGPYLLTPAYSYPLGWLDPRKSLP
jgi:hypothetical protein